MKSCPQCHHKPSKEELKFYPEYCSQCGTLYSALDAINQKKMRENENLKAWRVTRWRAKNGRGLIFGVPAFMVIMFFLYHIGHLVIANSKPISNKIYHATKNEHIAVNTTTQNDKIAATNLKQEKYVPANEASSKLILTSRKTLTIWLINEQTGKKIGPLLVTRESPETVYLERGRYIAKVIDNGKMSLSSVHIANKRENLNL